MNKILSNDALMMFIVGAVIIAATLVLFNCVFQSTMDSTEWREEDYRVKSGDSLWSISGKYCPDSVDRREWIDEIQVLNDLPDSTIHPGQRLTVLAPVK